LDQAHDRLAGLHILIIEDDLGTLDAASQALRGVGFDVTGAHTGAEGLALAREQPDLVVLEMKLPDIDGIEVCRRIKSDPETASVSILALSARPAGAGDRARGLDQGADAYLAHPIDLGELVATARALLRLRLSERARARREARVIAAERGHRTITNTASVGLLQVDGEGRTSFMNPAAEAIAGRAFAEVKGKVLHDVLHGVRRDGTPFPLAECPVCSVAMGGDAVRDQRQDIRRRDGTWIPARFSANPIVEDGERLGAVIELEDNSERVRSERARELFLGALGHDLRGPLHAMSIGSEMLLEMPELDAEARRTLERMRTSITRMNRLIDQTLLLVQSMVEGVPLERRETDLRKVLGTIIGEVSLRHGDRAIELRAPPRMIGVWDPDRLVQVVDNLVSNAVKYGDGTVTIDLVEEGEEVVFAVHNRGTPIPDEAVPTLFDPFRRADSRRGGLGLGLYIVDQIVRAHEGTVEVTSTPEAGTTFRIRLPRRA